MRTTWKPHEKHGQLTAQSDLPDTVYAFPNQRKEPLTDAQHVHNAVARFDQVMTSPMQIARWPSRTSRRLQSTITSSFRRRRGGKLAFIRNKNGRRRPAKGAAMRKREREDHG